LGVLRGLGLGVDRRRWVMGGFFSWYGGEAHLGPGGTVRHVNYHIGFKVFLIAPVTECRGGKRLVCGFLSHLMEEGETSSSVHLLDPIGPNF
jgi:hypothetical protein